METMTTKKDKNVIEMLVKICNNLIYDQEQLLSKYMERTQSYKSQFQFIKSQIVYNDISNDNDNTLSSHVSKTGHIPLIQFPKFNIDSNINNINFENIDIDLKIPKKENIKPNTAINESKNNIDNGIDIDSDVTVADR